MSDPQEPGEPVEEPTPVHDDVVGRAHEGLAEAEAAGRNATEEPAAAPEPASAEPDPSAGPSDAPIEPAADEPTAADEPAEPTRPAEPIAAEPVIAADEPAFATPALNEVHGTYGENVDTAATEAYAASRESDAALGAAAAASVAAEPAAPQPIFVQAPEEPRPRGNRGAAGGIGLIAAVCFAVLYLAAGLVIGLVTGDVATDAVGTWLTDALSTWGLWVPTIVFFIAFWLLGAIINRGRWGAWVIIGLLVGVAAWGGHLLGQLFEAPFWNITASQGADIVNAQLFAPLAIAAFIIGRELTIWFGAWAAARGKRMTELNVEARREYERTLEAGPQLAH